MVLKFTGEPAVLEKSSIKSMTFPVRAHPRPIVKIENNIVASAADGYFTAKKKQQNIQQSPGHLILYVSDNVDY